MWLLTCYLSTAMWSIWTQFMFVHLVLTLLTIDQTFAQTLNPLFECDFERVCTFTQDQTPLDDFDWIYSNGPTDASFTGPSADNTYKNETGTYLYIVSNAELRGTVARIHFRPNQPISQGWARLEFFYHMSDRDGQDRLGTLSVDGCGYPLWSMTGDQGNMWLKGAMTFRCEQESPDIVFEAIRGGRDSDIAIDDIIIYDVTEDPASFTTEGTTTNVSDTTYLDETGDDAPLFTTSTLTLIIVFSVIGFILLLCVVSTFVKKVVMK